MQRVTKHFKNNDIVHVLKIRSFFNLMLSEFFSQIAFNMQHFVIIFIIYDLTHSNTAVSGIILSFTIPAILFSLLAGVYVDRWDKKKVLFLTNFIRGLLLLPFLIPNTHPSIIYLLTFFIAVATQFFLPAESSVIPQLVPKNLLIPANAVFSAGIFTTVFIGYILSGPILLLIGKTSTFILLSLLFFISSVCVLFIKTKKQDTVKSLPKDLSVERSVKQEVKEIFTFIRKAKEVMNAIIILTLSQAIIFMFAALGPGYLATILKVQVESLSWILLAPAAFGMILGATVLGSISKKQNHFFLTSLGFFITGIVFLILPYGNQVASRGFVNTINKFLPSFLDITILHIIVFLAFIAGVANALVFVPANAVIQTNTHEAMRGRVYGFLNALVGSVSLLPVALAGGLADILGVATVISGIGVLMIVVATVRYILR